MLDRAGNADRDVELGSDDLAGLADLVVVRHEARIDRGARGADAGAELVGDLFEHGEVLAVLHAAAARDDDLGRRQFRTIRLRQFFADEFGKARIFGGADLLDRGRAALTRRREGGGADRDDLLRVGRLHGLDGVTGIDRALEGVRRVDGGDFRDLRDVEKRGDAGHEVLAHGGGRGDDRVIILGEAHDESGEGLRNRMRVERVVGDEHLLHAVELRGGFGHRVAALTGHENDDIAAELRSGGDGLRGRVVQRLVVVVCNNKRGHPITPASLSFDTSSAADSTLIPAERCGGSDTFTTSRWFFTSTPKSPGVFSSIGFFFAFMMFGSDA